MTLNIGGDDQTDYILALTERITRTSFDVTLIDPVDEPAISDSVSWGPQPDWAGTVRLVESNTWHSPDGTDHRYVKVTAANADALADNGAAPFDFSDAPDYSATYPWVKFVLSRTLKDATTEIRAKLTVDDLSNWACGMTVAVTSAADGLSAQTFTILEWSVSSLTDATGTPFLRYELDLGFGDYATATTSAADGGPLTPPTLPDLITEKAADEIVTQLETGPPEGTIREAIREAACPGIETPWGSYSPPAYIGEVYQSGDCGTESGAGGDYQFFDSTGASLLGYIEGGAIVFAGSQLVLPTDWDQTDPVNGQFSITGTGYSGTVTMFGRVNCEQPTPPV